MSDQNLISSKYKVRAAVTTALALAAGYASAPLYAQNQGGAGMNTMQIEEIVITAERREDTVQRSSLAIAVLQADQLKIGGVTQANDLQYVVPGLTVSNAGGIVQTYLRGVGTFASNARAEPSIANNINGVYIARPAGIGAIFFDLDRVEVLKGPQGTLYGRNATGGAINLITNKPRFDFSGNALVEGGDYNAVTGAGYLNVPLSDTFAVRVAGQVAERDGYLSDGYNDQDTQAGRLMALWKPSEKFSLLFTGEYVGTEGQGEATVPRSNVQATPSDPWTGPSDPLNIQPPTAAIPNGTRINNDGFTDIDVAAGSFELNWDLGFATLTALPAYRDSDIAYLTYTPGFSYNTAETSEQASMELRLGNSTDELKWVAGLYYFDEDQTETARLSASPIQNSLINTTATTESYAVFGQATYSLTDTFRVIGGLRYTDEDKTQNGASLRLNPAGGQIGLPTSNLGQTDFSNVSYKAGVEYDVAEENMLFLTVATGFKSGSFIPSIPAPNNTFKEEELTAYTLGSRNRFFDNRLQVNLEGFYWEYDDKQERFLSATNTGTVGLLTQNAGQATLYGLNIDMDFKLTENDEFHLGVEYLNSEYDSFTYQLVNPNDPNLTGLSQASTDCAVSLAQRPDPIANPNLPANASLQTVNCTGLDLVRAPELAGSFGYTRTFNIGSNWQLLSTVYSTFASEQYLSADFLSGSGEDDGYVLANVDLTLRSNNGRFAISAFGRNLGEEEVYTGGARYAFLANDPSLFYANIAAPRTYGMRVEVDF